MKQEKQQYSQNYSGSPIKNPSVISGHEQRAHQKSRTSSEIPAAHIEEEHGKNARNDEQSTTDMSALPRKPQQSQYDKRRDVMEEKTQ